MSYEEACAQLYNERLAKQQRQQSARDKFRQSVLDRQNKNQHNTPYGTEYRNEVAPEVGDSSHFTMPAILPGNEASLKYLIAKNIELKMLEPGRIQEANENIKRIKNFVNEQKAGQKLPA